MKNFKYLIISNYDGFCHYEAMDHTGDRPDIAKEYKNCSKSFYELPYNVREVISFNEYVCSIVDENYDLIIICEDGHIDINKFYEDEN